MATPIVDDLIERVRIRIAEPYTGMLTDNDMADFITEAQNDLLWRLPVPAVWFLTYEVSTDVVAAQTLYTFEAPDSAAPDFVMYVAVKYNDIYAKKLEIEDLRKWTNISDVSPSESKPHFYFTSTGINFMLGGGPADGITDGIDITYVKRPDDIVLDTTDLAYPRQYMPILEDYVAARGYENRRNQELYIASMQSYYEKIDRLHQRYQIGEDTQQYMSKVDRP